MAGPCDSASKAPRARRGASSRQFGVVLERALPCEATPEAHLILAVIQQAVADGMVPEPERPDVMSTLMQRRRYEAAQSRWAYDQRDVRDFFRGERLDLLCACVGLNAQWVRELVRDYAGSWAAEVA